MNLKKNSDLVSIIIVNWNGKKWLKKCLKSLENQTYKNIEIIVVDNASNDGSVEFVKRYFPKIIIVNNKINSGFPSANNLGVKISHGKYLLLINNDVWVEKDFLDSLVSFYKTSNLFVVSPKEKKYDKTDAGGSNYTIDITGSPAFFSPYRKNKLFFMSVCYLVKREDYLKTLGFDENHFAYYEDVDWFWRLQLLGKKFDYANGVSIYHAGAGSIGKGIKYKMFLYRNQNALQTLIKNYSLPTLAIILPIYLVQNIVEIVFFALLLKFDIVYSYFQGWWFNIINFPKIMKKRQWIQKRRKVSDFEIMKKMYWGPAKLKMLINYKI